MKKARFSRENGPRGILKPPKFFPLASLAQETPLAAFSHPKNLSHTSGGNNLKPISRILDPPLPSLSYPGRVNQF